MLRHGVLDRLGRPSSRSSTERRPNAGASPCRSLPRVQSGVGPPDFIARARFRRGKKKSARPNALRAHIRSGTRPFTVPPGGIQEAMARIVVEPEAGSPDRPERRTSPNSVAMIMTITVVGPTSRRFRPETILAASARTCSMNCKGFVRAIVFLARQCRAGQLRAQPGGISTRIRFVETISVVGAPSPAPWRASRSALCVQSVECRRRETDLEVIGSDSAAERARSNLPRRRRIFTVAAAIDELNGSIRGRHFALRVSSAVRDRGAAGRRRDDESFAASLGVRDFAQLLGLASSRDGGEDLVLNFGGATACSSRTCVCPS